MADDNNDDVLPAAGNARKDRPLLCTVVITAADGRAIEIERSGVVERVVQAGESADTVLCEGMTLTIREFAPIAPTVMRVGDRTMEVSSIPVSASGRS